MEVQQQKYNLILEILSTVGFTCVTTHTPTWLNSSTLWIFTMHKDPIRVKYYNTTWLKKVYIATSVWKPQDLSIWCWRRFSKQNPLCTQLQQYLSFSLCFPYHYDDLRSMNFSTFWNPMAQIPRPILSWG